jgi:hypothetical protein
MWSEAELNCVRMYICLKFALIQLEMGISTMRYFPPKGTAGFEREPVSGNKRVPFPPPSMIDKTSVIFYLLEKEP